MAAFAALLAVSHELTFYSDEWNVILRSPDWSGDALLAPLNEHPYLGPVVIYKALLALVGLESNWPYRAVNLALLSPRLRRIEYSIVRWRFASAS